MSIYQTVEELQRRLLRVPRRYNLPNENGEGWAIVFIDDATGCFAGLSDWGNFAYRWNLAGMPENQTLRGFLLTCDDSYLLPKLGQGCKEYDAEKTAEAVKEAIISDRRDGSFTKFAARREWERLDDFNDLSTEWEFAAFCADTRIDDIGECYCSKYVSDVTSFVAKVMPRLRKLIAEDLKGESP